jgi:hypothetical protein
MPVSAMSRTGKSLRGDRQSTKTSPETLRMPIASGQADEITPTEGICLRRHRDCSAYYPGCNALVPLSHHAEESDEAGKGRCSNPANPSRSAQVVVQPSGKCGVEFG